jgi:1-acyl-sn-glycerol-3-phosphate acyltransferase
LSSSITGSNFTEFPRAAKNRIEREATMMRFRAFIIVAVFVTVTVVLAPVQWFAVKLSLPLRRTLPNRYHRFVCRLFGVRVSIIGNPVAGGVLMAANHSGWLDIPILSAAWPVSFVAKSEVDSWPFFGTLARLQRSVFVRRERAQTVANREMIRRRLLDGDALIIFPEGTSSDGNRVLPFKSALLSAAEVRLNQNRPVPVQPVSIAYTTLNGIPMGRENRPFFAWYGDMELVPHLWEALKTGPIDVIVEFHPAIRLDEVRDRKALAQHCETTVRAGLVRALSGGKADNHRSRHDSLPANSVASPAEEAA